jgi:trimethylamine-N-oxide reductase (cytochrome c)
MTRKKMRARGPEVSRRGFLGGTAAVGVGTLAGSTVFSKAAKAAAPKGILTTAHWGVMRAIVEDGKFVKAIPFEKDPAPVTAMIEATPSTVYSPSRVKYPMVRKG